MDDLINRQDAIDAISKILSERCGGNTVWWKPVAEAVVKNLPSTQPEQAIKDCRNCKYGKYNDYHDTYFCYNAEDCSNWDKWETSAQLERPKDIIQNFHDYQVEWLKSHCDIELEPELEMLIVRFLNDTANCYIMEIER